MKKLLASILLAFAIIGYQDTFAGESPKAPTEFAEFQIECPYTGGDAWVDIFGNYIFQDGNSGAGGGIAASYFLTEHIGVGVEGYYADIADPFWSGGLDLILRAPIEDLCITPYLKGGMGWAFFGNDDSLAYDVGAGVRFALDQDFDVFVEGNHTWLQDGQDFSSVRAGIGIRFW